MILAALGYGGVEAFDAIELSLSLSGLDQDKRVRDCLAPNFVSTDGLYPDPNFRWVMLWVDNVKLQKSLISMPSIQLYWFKKR